MLLGVAAASANGQGASTTQSAPRMESNSNFNGIWVYEGSHELDGSRYRVVHQLNLIQRGQRVCGCWNKVGAPSDKIDYRVLGGWVSGDLLDFVADSGTMTMAPGEYSSTYPFKPASAERFQRRGNRLYWGVFTPRESDVLTKGFPPPAQTKYLENDYVLRRTSSKFNSEACDDGWKKFARACLADTKK